MFWLKKVVSQFIMPLPMVVILLLLALLLWRYRNLARTLVMVALAWLLLLSSPVTSQLLISPLETQYAVNRQPMTDGCVVLVLGSGHDDSIHGSAVQQLSPTALARLTEGVSQLQLGTNCQLVVSGWSGGLSTRSHADVMADAAVELGVNKDQIMVLSLAKDTVEEAQFMASEYGKQTFRLVTSASHMPRSVAVFQHAGLHVVPAPTDFIARNDYWWRLDAKNVWSSQRAIHEYVGLIWFKLTQGK